mmetsp:Transcript_11547/g.25393  ORF Transcript_11547/g.25393 Transcript_11547/m.25393 type:complete len:213 (-) Transcript_11547:46-684(-)
MQAMQVLTPVVVATIVIMHGRLVKNKESLHAADVCKIDLLRGVVGLGRQGSEESVAGELCVAAGDDVADRSADEGTAVEDEGKGNQSGLVVVSSEGPPSKASHHPGSVPHEDVRDDALADRLLSAPADVRSVAGVVFVVLLGQDGFHVVLVHLAVVDVEHGQHGQETNLLHDAKLTLTDLRLLLHDRHIGRNHQGGRHGRPSKKGWGSKLQG